jgi:hypothetical protein
VRDSERINRGYVWHLKVLEERPGGALQSDTAAKALRRLAVAELEVWLEAVTHYPLLPDRILPSDYLGPKALRRGWEFSATPAGNCAHLAAREAGQIDVAYAT